MRNRPERRQAGLLLLSRASSEKAGQYFIRQVGNHRSLLHVYHKWHTDTISDIDLVKAQEMCQHIPPNIHLCWCSFLETFQQNELQESLYTMKRSCAKRPSEVAPHAPALEEYFRASGD